MARKKSRGRPLNDYTRRLTNVREQRPSVLIVCEGERTEPNYFRAFRAGRVLELEIQGLGANTDNLVERTIALRDAGDYDQTWAVFDRDSFPPHNFNRALTLARNAGIYVAYSNEAFELWYVLHFD